MNIQENYEGNNRIENIKSEEDDLDEEFVLVEKRDEYPKEKTKDTYMSRISSYITIGNIVTCIKVIGEVAIQINELQANSQGRCSRCGRNNHTSSMCYARRDMSGKRLY